MSGVGRGIGVLVGGIVIVEREGAVLGRNLGRPIETNGTLLHSCARATRYSQITLGVDCSSISLVYSIETAGRMDVVFGNEVTVSYKRSSRP